MAKQLMDGCTAATWVAYALSDVGTIYPITPIAEMGQTAQRWALVDGRLNIWGNPMDVREMESELGAAGATHGAAAAGALATTFTCSQGLMLMLPNMFKIAGEQLPAVFHVGTRSVASHALSIFGDHQDVMTCRSTGFAFLASASVQETMDLALVAHLSAIDGSLPVVHFMDGWRTSNEYASIDVIGYADMASLVDTAKVAAIRARGLNPRRPELRGTSQNPGVYFQNREACNPYYDAFPAVVQGAMDRVGALTGRRYHLVDYSGAPDATDVVVVMGSAGEVAREEAARLVAAGRKAGVVQVRLFHPFPSQAFVAALPPTVRRIAVLDRTKEPGAVAEPLCLAVTTALHRAGRGDILVGGGRYGLSSKDFSPAMARAVFDNLAADKPRMEFTVGITDDVTRLSLPVAPEEPEPDPDTFSAVFYGMGADGTVGSVKMLASIANDLFPLHAQAYFNYSAKKSGGYTYSQLRLSQRGPVTALYDIGCSDYVACSKASYVDRFELASTLRRGGTFVLNCPWTDAELPERLPLSLKRALADRQARLYVVDADALALREDLGLRVNTVMATAFLSLCSLMPGDEARQELARRVKTVYMHEGGDVVARNLRAMAAAAAALRSVDYTQLAGWDADCPTRRPETPAAGMPPADCASFVDAVARPCFELLGDSLPVSAFAADGHLPPGTTASEKRRIAQLVPVWDPDKCVTCTLCSLVCAHAAIRPVVMDPAEAAAAPPDFVSREPLDGLDGYRFRIQVFAEDCTGCSSCARVCPGHALTMMPAAPQWEAQKPLVDYSCTAVTWKGGLEPRFTVRGSQLYQPLLQFSGACGGCGETPYVKLLTQLMGERLVMANATGCSSIWGGSYPSNPYCVNAAGHGPAWANSLFEDNAEYGYGMAVAMRDRREALRLRAEWLAADPATRPAVAVAARAWADAWADHEASQLLGQALVEAIGPDPADPRERAIVEGADLLGTVTVWAVGGDGWAYDIGYAGLDHVMASGEDINVLVLDTECYSNTGGQMSKATPLGAVAKYAPLGKRTVKKDLARMMACYGHVYVAQIALGANFQHAIDALREAAAHPGPSIVVAYCPCLEHGIRMGLGDSIIEERRAVECGYWNLFRYNPARREQGLDPWQEDAPAPQADRFDAYLDGEDRYADLRMLSPAEAAILRPELRSRLYSVYATVARNAVPPKRP